MSISSDQGLPNARGKRRPPWRQDPVILARLTEVEKRVLEGKANTAIAVDLDVDEATVRNDRKRLHELWREQVGGEVRTRRLARIQELEEIRDKALRVANNHERYGLAVLTGSDIDGKAIARDDRGKAEFRGQTAQALNVARQAVMDAAKVEGLVVEKVSPTDGQGKTLDLAALVLMARQDTDASAE